MTSKQTSSKHVNLSLIEQSRTAVILYRNTNQGLFQHHLHLLKKHLKNPILNKKTHTDINDFISDCGLEDLDSASNKDLSIAAGTVQLRLDHLQEEANLARLALAKIVVAQS